FRSLRAALGIANVNLHDTRRPESWATIRPTGDDRTELVLHYADPPDEASRLTGAVARTGRALRRLGCLVPPGMTRVLPKGASVHYSGTLPMTRSDQGPLSCESSGRLRGMTNLIIADGATFPALPAKNLTFTLMANAARLASAV
ncbi:MAG: GMC oxidoreductase, partial [Gemmatimonadota bacterium]|nr:GMC oxidoreductase [Gemmatimonadota bacterium]